MLEMPYDDASIPEVVSTTSGSQAHWSGAEPNELIHRKVMK
jgi:hypothetical protein